VQPFLERIVTHLERVEKGTIRSTFEPEVVTDADALEDERPLRATASTCCSPAQLR
jgi:hypothetical protein